jgi:hypothetical protein
VSTEPGGPQISQTSFFQGNKLKTSTAEMFTIADLGSGRIDIVMPQQGTHWSGTLQDLASRGMDMDYGMDGSYGQGMPQGDMSGYGEYGQQPGAQQGYGQAYGSDGYGEAGEAWGDPSDMGFGMGVSVRQTGKTATVAGYQCHQNVVLIEGEVLAELWISDQVNPGSEVNMKKYLELKGLSGDMTMMFGGDSPELQAALERGYAMRTVIPFGPGEAFVTEVTKVEKRDIADSEFQVPQGLRKISTAELNEVEVISTGMEPMDGGSYGTYGDPYGNQPYGGQQQPYAGNGGQYSGGTYPGQQQPYAGYGDAYGTESYPEEQAPYGQPQAGWEQVPQGQGQAPGYGTDPYQQPYGGQQQGYSNQQGNYGTYTPYTQQGSSGSVNPYGQAYGGAGQPFMHPEGLCAVSHDANWRPQAIPLSEDYTLYALQHTQSQYSMIIIAAQPIMPGQQEAYAQIATNQLVPQLFPGARPASQPATAKCCAGGRSVSARYQDFTFHDHGMQFVVRLYLAFDQHTVITHMARATVQEFNSMVPAFDSIFQSTTITPVNTQAMQAVVGRWVGVSTRQGMTFWDGSGNQISGSGGPVSTEHIYIFYPDGRCESNSFTAASGGEGMGLPGQFGGGSGGQQGGMYFIAGSNVYVVGPNWDYFVLDGSQQGVLIEGTIQYVRQ